LYTEIETMDTSLMLSCIAVASIYCKRRRISECMKDRSATTLIYLVWCSTCEFPSLCLRGWWPCWCMLACAGCWNYEYLGLIESENSVDCNAFWSEGWELCSSPGVLCPLAL
jgi:hypothetical protein